MPGSRKLGRPTDHRKSMLRGMVTFLLENGKIEINDPNSIENSNKLWNFDDISSQINNLWAMRV